MPESKISPSPDISDRTTNSPPNFSGGARPHAPMTFVLLLADARTHSVRGSPANVLCRISFSAAIWLALRAGAS